MRKNDQHKMALAKRVTSTFLLLVATIGVIGCSLSRSQLEKTVLNETAEIASISQRADFPSPTTYSAVDSAPPITINSADSLGSFDYRGITLVEAIHIATQNSNVLRELGGTVLRNPEAVKTYLAQQIQNTDPRFSREAALSAFDTQLTASAFYNNNDRIFNNSFFAGGATGFKQDLHNYEVALAKRTATGSLLTLRGISDFDSNNAPANNFPSAWDSYVEGEIRQPLLQGGGVEFNRIAGPGGIPGVYNGLLIARVDSDISESEIRVATRDLISNVENAYWDLYYAYRVVDARRKALEVAERSWKTRSAKADDRKSVPGGVALAEEQYFRFKEEFDEVVAGRLVQGTQSRNGSTGGTLRGNGGLLVSERRLRLLIGLDSSDGVLLRTVDEPSLAEFSFDWNVVKSEALSQRTEFDQQNLRVSKREMELLAARNFLNPRLDLFGRYRLRGFGDTLTGGGNNNGSTPASSIGNLGTGDLQEWTVGVELAVPIGYRQGHAAVANAELKLARERAILVEQQREVLHDLGNAVADVDRAFLSTKNTLNRYLSAKKAATAIAATEDEKTFDIDRLLDAQRREVEAEIQFFRARSEYAVSLKNVHFEKGSLMNLNELRMVGPVEATNMPMEPVYDLQEVVTPPAFDGGLDTTDANPFQGV